MIFQLFKKKQEEKVSHFPLFNYFTDSKGLTHILKLYDGVITEYIYEDSELKSEEVIDL